MVVAEGVEGAEGETAFIPKKEFHHDGREHGFEGKRREPWHPYDRRDGTGRGRGAAPKRGHGKGNWGTVEGEAKEAVNATPENAEEKPVDAEKVEDATAEVKAEEAPVEEEKKEVVEEEQDDPKQMTFAEYQAQKKRSLLKKEARGHDATKKGNFAEAPVKEKVQGISNTLRDQEVYNVVVGKSELSNLLSFQGQEDDYYVERSEGDRRGGRGGRGGRGARTEGAPRGGRGGRGAHTQGGARGGRQQQLRVDESAFPSLA